MRADGSIKSLTTGVSTVDKSQWNDRAYMTQCVNMRNDQQDGLRRRGGAELVSELLTYVDGAGATVDIKDFAFGTDVLKPFEIDGDDYWLYAQADPGINGMNMAVFTKNGVKKAVDLQAGTYLNSADGNDSVRLVSSGETVFVVNTNETVEAIAASGPIYTNHSMVSVRNSPLVYSSINIKWKYPDYSIGSVTYEIGENHATQPIPDLNDVDTGVNTTASHIAAKIAAQIVTDSQTAHLEIDQEGATIVFRNVTSVVENQRDFSSVIVEDGSGGAFLAINGTILNLSELPRFSHPGALLTVKPDPSNNRGQFYMRAEPVLEAEAPDPLPTANIAVTSEVLDTGTQYVSGFSDIFGTVGAIFPSSPIAAFPSQNCYALQFGTDKPVADGNKTTVQFGLEGPLGESVPADNLQFLDVWDNTGADPVRVCQVFMYQTVAEPNHVSGGSVHIWEGTVDDAILLVDGRDYQLYYADVVGTFSAVPEVRWVEDSAPDQDTEINSATFPHVLHRLEDGTFQFGSMNQVSTAAVRSLERRASGDDETNPFPSFVGKTIKDIATFQSRLCILELDRVSMSVTTQPNDWFRGTVTQLLSTSPISIQSTSAGGTSLSHFVEHNNDLMVFGTKGQFRFDGKIAVTPQTAGLPQASSYPVRTLAVPKSSGNDVFFATTYGNSSGLSQFSLDPQIDNLSIAKPLTEKQVGLLTKEIQQIIATPNIGVVVCKLKDVHSELYPLEFEPQIDILKPINPTWATWEFNMGLKIISMRSSDAHIDFMATGKGGAADDGQPRLYRIDLFKERTARDLFSQATGAVHLDASLKFEAVTTSVDLGADYPIYTGAALNPVRPVSVIQGTGCPVPGDAVTYTQVGQVLTLDTDMGGGEVEVGYEFDSILELPDLDTRDASGIIQTQAHLRVTDLHVTLTGEMDAVVARKYGGTQYPVQSTNGNPSPSLFSPERYTTRVQVKQDADKHITVLSSIGAKPLSLHQIEWRGTYIKVGRRF